MSSCVNSDSFIPGIGVAVFNGAVSQNFWCKTFRVEPDRTCAFAVNERLLHEDGGSSSTHIPVRNESEILLEIDCL